MEIIITMEVIMIRVFLLSQFLSQSMGQVLCPDKIWIVNLLNNYRMLVANGSLENQPKASNMQYLVWDQELGILAQEDVDRRLESTIDVRSNTINNSMQQIHAMTNTETDWASIIQTWFDENKFYKYGIPCNDDSSIHYKTIVTAKLQYVGCAISSGQDRDQRYYVACTFKPGEALDSEVPYEVGPGCEELCCYEQCGPYYGENCPENNTYYY